MRIRKRCQKEDWKEHEAYFKNTLCSYDEEDERKKANMDWIGSTIDTWYCLFYILVCAKGSLVL